MKKSVKTSLILLIKFELFEFLSVRTVPWGFVVGLRDANPLSNPPPPPFFSSVLLSFTTMPTPTVKPNPSFNAEKSATVSGVGSWRGFVCVVQCCTGADKCVGGALHCSSSVSCGDTVLCSSLSPFSPLSLSLSLSHHQELRDACKGLGTDEAKVIRALTSITTAQRQEVIVKYKTLFGKVKCFLLLPSSPPNSSLPPFFPSFAPPSLTHVPSQPGPD